MRFLEVLFLGLSAVAARAQTPLCFVPGMGGGNDFIFRQVPQALALRGIEFRGIDIGNRGSIETRARRLGRAIEGEWARDPDFKCDLFGHSLGGIVIRYAVNHVWVRHPLRGRVLLRQAARSLTTASSPHRGTPYGDLISVGAPFVDPGLNQMSAHAMRRFNDPRYAKTYSPEVPGLPTFSFRTYIKEASEAPDALRALAFRWLSWMLMSLRRDPQNDGLVPTASQGFGQVLADFERPHSYFSDPTRVDPPVVDFYEEYARYLNATLP